ncbi:MAG: HlyD family efflux transporter periplasmic adaptor subunit [Pseudomonadota bacterium]
MRTELYRSAAVNAVHTVFADVSVLAPTGIVTTSLLGFLSAALLVASAFLIQVPDRVRATALLMPSAGVVDVRAQGAGVVERVYAQAGARVRSGQPLLDIARDRATATAGSLRAQRRVSLARQESLIRAAYRQRRELRRARKAAGEMTLQHLRDSQDRLQTGTSLAEYQLDIARRRLGRLRGLAERGLLPVDQQEQAEMAVVEAETERLNLMAAIASAEQEQNMAELALYELDSEADIDDVEMDLRLARLDDKAVDDADGLERRLVAPVDGRVIHLTARAGHSVTGSERLLVIVPDDARLEARVYVSSADAAGLMAGQVVRLTLPGLPDVSSQPLLATLSDIGRLAVLPGNIVAPVHLTGPVFEMRAVLSQSAAARLTHKPGVGAGLSLQAEIVRSHRTLAEWLLQTVRRA